LPGTTRTVKQHCVGGCRFLRRGHFAASSFCPLLSPPYLLFS
jgi:hypothetical protein